MGMPSSAAMPDVNAWLETTWTFPLRLVNRRWWFRGGGRILLARSLTSDGTRPSVVTTSTPGTPRRGSTVLGDVSNAPALITPGLVVVELPHLTRRKANKEIKADGGWRRVRVTPYNDDARDGGPVLEEATGRINTWVVLGKGWLHLDGVTGENETRQLPRSFRRVMGNEWQRQKLAGLYSLEDVRALT